jgi:catechol 2,3-dioxygenase-like lactoylglutathione lyase family enzyme
MSGMWRHGTEREGHGTEREEGNEKKERQVMDNVITGWHHIAYPVPDIEASGEWYCRVLNGTIVMRQGINEKDTRAHRNRQLWIQAGEAIINLAEGPAIVRPQGAHFYHYAMYSPGEQLDSWIAHLKANGVEVMGPYGHGGVSLLSLYFDDPDGYRLEITFEFGDYETAKAAALSRGGALGNPDGEYKWE